MGVKVELEVGIKLNSNPLPADGRIWMVFPENFLVDIGENLIVTNADGDLEICDLGDDRRYVRQSSWR